MTEISYEDALEFSNSYWDDPVAVDAVTELNRKELQQWKTGTKLVPFSALANLIHGQDISSVLEVGSGTGVYRHVVDVPFYVALDRSSLFSAVAAAGGADAVLGDACRLPHLDRSFDCTIEGCVMLHDMRWTDILTECCRVARQWVVLSRTPYSNDGRFRYYEKVAYGQPCMEIHFPQSIIVQIMATLGFAYHDSSELFSHWYWSTTSLWRRYR